MSAPSFAEWLAQEMPAGTVIGDPAWWADRIARRLDQYLDHYLAEMGVMLVPVAEHAGHMGGDDDGSLHADWARSLAQAQPAGYVAIGESNLVTRREYGETADEASEKMERTGFYTYEIKELYASQSAPQSAEQQPAPDVSEGQAIGLLARVQGWWQNTDGDMPASLEQDISALLTAAPTAPAVQAEPVAYISHTSEGDFLGWERQFDAPSHTPLYTTPQPAPVAPVGVEDWRETERLRLLHLRTLLEGFEVEIEAEPLVAPATYLDKVSVVGRFQPAAGGAIAAKRIAAILAAPPRDPPALAQQPAAREEMSPDFTDSARAAIAWVLYHHQGGSSPVGQPLRFALGMGADEQLPDWRIAEAKRWAVWAGVSTADFHRQQPAAGAQAQATVDTKPDWWVWSINGTYTGCDNVEPPEDAYDEGSLIPLWKRPPSSVPTGASKQPATIPRLPNCGRYTAIDNTGQHYHLNHAGAWQTFQGQQSRASVRELAAELVDEIDGLVDESEGVCGFHLNGDPSPWGELLPGGEFERLSSLGDLRCALAEQVEVVVDQAMVFRMAVWMAKNDGHDDPHRLIWEGSPPEPWGEVWQRYEDDARAALTAALSAQQGGES